MQFLALRLIDLYQIVLSPQYGLLAPLAAGGMCKYEIHCSEYTKQQIKEKGVIQGAYLGFRRVISCR